MIDALLWRHAQQERSRYSSYFVNRKNVYGKRPPLEIPLAWLEPFSCLTVDSLFMLVLLPARRTSEPKLWPLDAIKTIFFSCLLSEKTRATGVCCAVSCFSCCWIFVLFFWWGGVTWGAVLEGKWARRGWVRCRGGSHAGRWWIAAPQGERTQPLLHSSCHSSFRCRKTQTNQRKPRMAFIMSP